MFTEEQLQLLKDLTAVIRAWNDIMQAELEKEKEAENE